jgi:tetratricopeptide (TPR) repeat protein
MKLKKRIAGLVLTLLCTHSLFAQFSAEEQAQIDSLNLVVKSKSAHDTAVANAYICLSELLASSNLDTVIYLCTKAQHISEKNLAAHPNQQIAKSFKTTLAAAFNNIGYVYMNKTNNALALDYYQKSIDVEIANGNKKGTASAYNNMGLIYYDQGDIPLALEYYHKSLKIKEEFNDQKGMAMSFNNIGYVHAEQGDKALALDYYNKSLKIQEKLETKKAWLCLTIIWVLFILKKGTMM